MGLVNHARVVITGTYLGVTIDDEEFQMGINFAVGPNVAPEVGPPSHFYDAAQAVLEDTSTDYNIRNDFTFEGGVSDLNPVEWLRDQIMPAIKVWWESAAVMSNIAILKDVKLYTVGDNGRVLQTPYGPAKATATPKIVIKGVASGGVMPLQMATVVSWRTANTTRKGKGRIFLPTTEVSSLTSTGQFQPTYVTGVLIATAKLVKDMGIHLSTTNCDAVVCTAAAAQLSRILSVRVGNVPDTQRRRRRQLVESYESVLV